MATDSHVNDASPVHKIVSSPSQIPAKAEGQPCAYRYDALPTTTSIRILKLHVDPKEDDSWIRVSMRTVDLEEKPLYDTLSYTWGHPRTVYLATEPLPEGTGQERCVPILCDGKVLYVTQNLEAFLQHLRSLFLHLPGGKLRAPGRNPSTGEKRDKVQLDMPAELWIDAVCINQDDLLERNSQVRMMSSIYSKSRKLFIWLGEHDIFSSNTMNFLAHLANVPLEQAEGLRSYDITAPQVRDVTKAAPEDWWALYALLHRAWFHRAWIVQELAFGDRPMIMCGSVILTWGTLYHGAMFLYRSGLDIQVADFVSNEILGTRAKGIDEEIYPRKFDLHDPPRLKCTMDMTMETTLGTSILRIDNEALDKSDRGEAYDLLSLLDNMRTTSATDGRDKIFAFLDLAARNCPSPARTALISDIEVDYRKSTEEIYLETTWHILTMTGQLDVLSSVQDRSWTKISGLPSWVPDWSSRQVPNKLVGYLQRTRWAASGSLQWKLPSDYGMSFLPVQGAYVDTIVGAAVPEEELTAQRRMKINLNKIAEIALGLPRVYPWAWGRTKVGADDQHFQRYQEPVSQPPSRVRPFEINTYPAQHSIEVPMAQSRVEALWRTLIADCFRGKSPADPEAGFGFGDSFIDSLQRAGKMYALNSTSANQHDQPGRVRNTNLEYSYRAYCETHVRLVESELNCRYDAEDPLQPFHPREELSKAGLEVGLPVTGIGFIPLDNAPLDENGRLKKLSTQEGIRMVAFNSQMNRASVGRRVFRTSKDFLGNGPRSLEAGDQIWILAGGKVPYVLRPSADGKYQLVGEAYVHGIMHGETLRFTHFKAVDIQLI